MNAIAAHAGRRRHRPVARLPLATWIAVIRERRALAALTDAELADIGLSREAASAEAARPFWDVNAR